MVSIKKRPLFVVRSSKNAKLNLSEWGRVRRLSIIDWLLDLLIPPRLFPPLHRKCPLYLVLILSATILCWFGVNDIFSEGPLKVNYFFLVPSLDGKQFEGHLVDIGNTSSFPLDDINLTKTSDEMILPSPSAPGLQQIPVDGHPHLLLLPL